MRNKPVLIFVGVFLATAFAMGTIAFRNAHKGSKIFSSLSKDPQWEDASWIFLLNPPSQYREGIQKGFQNANPHFLALLLDFNDIKKIPPTEQAEFFKIKMQPLVSELCSGTFLKDSTECDSAHVISQLSGIQSADKTDSALPFLKFQSQFERLKDPQSHMNFLVEQEKSAQPGSIALQAMKTAHARTAIRVSDFGKAVELLRPELNSSPKADPVWQLMQGEMTRTLCQSQALGSCNTSPIASCGHEEVWQSWSKGCQLRTAPQNSKDVTEFLGFWWNQALSKNKVDFDKWEATKPTAKEISDLPISEVKLDGIVFETLDFVLSVKAEVPKELMERAVKISPNSPLWVWAQKQALKEFGPQWVALMPSHEQKLIAYFNLVPKYSHREVASEQKE